MYPIWHPTITCVGRFILDGGVSFNIYFITKCIKYPSYKNDLYGLVIGCFYQVFDFLG